LGTGGTTVGGGSCAAAQVTDNKRAAIAKKQERITFMTFSAARLFKFCPARLQHQMSDCRAVVRPASGHVLLESLHQRGPYYDRMKSVSLARLSAFAQYPLRADAGTSEARMSTAIQRGDVE
jgi:hypothetical protein